MNELMTILFIAFDGYDDIWDDCIGVLKKFWGECPYRILFVNNEKAVEWEGIEVLHAGKDAEWSRKVQIAMNYITTPYVCLLLEDFLVGDYIDTDVIQKTLHFIKKKNIRYFKLVNMSRPGKNRDKKYDGYRFLHVIPEDDEYGVSLQAAIWDKSYLISLLGEENYNAWIFEFNRVKEAQGKKHKAKEGCVFDERNIFNLQHGVIQSKYLPGTIRYFKNKGIKLNLEREIMTYREFYRMRMIAGIKSLIPSKVRKPVKKLMEKFGMEFVSTIRDR